MTPEKLAQVLQYLNPNINDECARVVSGIAFDLGEDELFSLASELFTNALAFSTQDVELYLIARDAE